MYTRLTVFALILALSAAAVAQEAPSPNDAKPAEPATQPAPPPPPPDPLLLTVGQIEVHQSQLNRLLAQFPAYQRSSAMARALSFLAGDALRREFIRLQELKVDEQKYAAQVATLRERLEKQIEQRRKQFEKDMVAMRGDMALHEYIQEQISDEKIKKFMEDNPRFFDGTRVEVSHVLIKCSLFDSSEVQAAARKKLVDVVGKIRSRALTFAEAATEYSDCESKATGGELGSIEFAAPLDRFFTMQAFRTEPGQMSGIFRTKDGWHVLLVTKVEEGDRTAKPWKNPKGQEVSAEDLAKTSILAELDNKIMLQAMGKVKVTNHMPQKPTAPPTAPKPAE